MNEFFVISVILAAGKVGNGPSEEDRDEATDAGVVHIRDRVELCKRISVTEMFIRVCNFIL